MAGASMDPPGRSIGRHPRSGVRDVGRVHGVAAEERQAAAGRAAHRRQLLQGDLLQRRDRAARRGDRRDRAPGRRSHPDVRLSRRDRRRTAAARSDGQAASGRGARLQLQLRRARLIEPSGESRRAGHQSDQPLRTIRAGMARIADGPVDVRRHVQRGDAGAGRHDRADGGRQPGEDQGPRNRPDDRRAKADAVAGRAGRAACHRVCRAAQQGQLATSASRSSSTTTRRGRRTSVPAI